jgi:hypothetical protein
MDEDVNVIYNIFITAPCNDDPEPGSPGAADPPPCCELG